MNIIRKEFDIDELHTRGIKGKNVTVAVIDTGVYVNHMDLRDSLVTYIDMVNKRRNAYDDNGHGTHIAGMILGRGILKNGFYKGIAPEASLISIKVLDKNGKGKIRDVINGLDWIVKNKDKYNIKIVNMSAGANNIESKDEELLIRSVEKLWDDGIVVIAAAGNNGPERNSISVPGNSKKIITVGAYDDNKPVYLDKEQSMVNYSGRGPTKECIVKPEIVAPGYKIISCSNKGNYESRSGTSMSTPVVTGMCALLLGEYQSLTPKEVKKILYDTAIDLGLPKNTQGWGKINLQKFLLRE